MKTFSILDFGAVADGIANDAGAIQRAIDTAHASGGGRVLVPSNTTVLAGSFELRTGIDFHIAEGAVLRSATRIEDFPGLVFGSGEEADKRYWIGAKHGHDITLSGTGTIDGQCRAFALGEEEHIFRPTLSWRPAMTCFEDIERITVRDLTLRDSANWTLHFTGCRDVHAHDLRIFNNLKFPNADGIDPDHCQRVRIERCHIVAADDCIVLKNTAPYSKYGPCEDVEVSDCRLESVSSAFKIGSESHGDFRRIVVRDCVVERSNRGLAIQLRDTGTVEDVVFRNIRISTHRFAPVFWGAGEPIYVTALPRTHETQGGNVRNVRFENIACESENGVFLYSHPAGRISGLVFENVSLTLRESGQWRDGLVDIRPCPGGLVPEGCEAYGEETPWGRPARHPVQPVFLQGVDSTSVAGLSFFQGPTSASEADTL